jgi:prefoldin subunit 5
MKNYTNVKKEKKKYKEHLDKLNQKTDKLSNNTNKINNMIDNLKVSKLNKDNFIISKSINLWHV